MLKNLCLLRIIMQKKFSPLSSSAYNVTNLHGAPAANVNVKIMTNIVKPLFYIMECILMDMLIIFVPLNLNLLHIL